MAQAYPTDNKQKLLRLVQSQTSLPCLIDLELKAMDGFLHVASTLRKRCCQRLQGIKEDKEEVNKNRRDRRGVEMAYIVLQEIFQQRRKELEQQQREGIQQEQEHSRHQEYEAMETDSAEGDLEAEGLDESQRVAGTHIVPPSHQQEGSHFLGELLWGLVFEQEVDLPQMETAQQQRVAAGPESKDKRARRKHLKGITFRHLLRHFQGHVNSLITSNVGSTARTPRSLNHEDV